MYTTLRVIITEGSLIDSRYFGQLALLYLPVRHYRFDNFKTVKVGFDYGIKSIDLNYRAHAYIIGCRVKIEVKISLRKMKTSS